MQKLNDLVLDRQQIGRLANSMQVRDTNIKKDDTYYIGEANANHIQVDREEEGNFLFSAIAGSPRKWTAMKAKANEFKWETVLEHGNDHGVFKFALPLSEAESSFLRKNLRLRRRKNGTGTEGAISEGSSDS